MLTIELSRGLPSATIETTVRPNARKATKWRNHFQVEAEESY